MIKGKIKAGRGLFIGNAGEYYIMAELLKRDVIAALAPRNNPSFDILASKGDFTFKIGVKTRSQGYPIWQWSVKKDRSIFHDLSEKGDFTVLVDLAMDIKDMNYYIVPTIIIDKWLESDFEKWLSTPGKNNRKHSPTNPKRNLEYRLHENELINYRNNWELMWE